MALCAGISPVIGEFPSQRPVTRSFDVFFDLYLNIQLNIQSRRRRLEAQSHSLWRHCIYFLRCTYLCLPSMLCNLWLNCYINTLRPRQNSSHFADDIFKVIFSYRSVSFRFKFHWKLIPNILFTCSLHVSISLDDGLSVRLHWRIRVDPEYCYHYVIYIYIYIYIYI